jgi:hypothetical protein
MKPNIDNQDLNTILAALRAYQAAGYGEPCNRPLAIHDIATNMDNETSMDDAGIDDLCERLNVDCGADGTEVASRDDLQTVISAGIDAVQELLNPTPPGNARDVLHDWAVQAADYLSESEQTSADTGTKDATREYYACPECGCTDIQCTAWVDVNAERIHNGDAPFDDKLWCPQCADKGYEGTFKSGFVEKTDTEKPLVCSTDVDGAASGAEQTTSIP